MFSSNYKIHKEVSTYCFRGIISFFIHLNFDKSEDIIHIIDEPVGELWFYIFFIGVTYYLISLFSTSNKMLYRNRCTYDQKDLLIEKLSSTENWRWNWSKIVFIGKLILPLK